MSLEQERRKLTQEHNLNYMRTKFQPLDMIPVYRCSKDRLLFGSLVPEGKKEEVVEGFGSNHSWPGQIGTSGFFNLYDGVEPIVLPREFHGLKANYQEISEEFRIFYNLYHDRDSDTYIKFGDAGSETIVAAVSHDEVRIRVKELMDFLAQKEMYLCLGFDYSEFSDSTLDKLGLQERVCAGSEDLMHWVLGFRDNSTNTTRASASSLFHGIRFIRPLNNKASQTDNNVRRYQDFIVGLDETGREITRSCNPATIYHPDGVAGYLTPVVFEQAVLDKYLSRPSRYSVSAFAVSCVGLWYLRIDNDRNDGKVVVHLGDLAKLPTFEEQSHWRSHNIASDAGLSETAFRSQVLAEPANPSRLEYKFRAAYTKLGELSEEHLGWQLLRPLHQDDRYRLFDVRVPTHNEQKSFDDFVGNLHNVLIDSLDSKQLAVLVPSEIRKQKDITGKSISLLEEVFTSRELEGAEHIEFLRDLNELRNKVDGHRKGSEYVGALHRFGTEDDLRFISDRIMHQAVEFLGFVCAVVPALR